MKILLLVYFAVSAVFMVSKKNDPTVVYQSPDKALQLFYDENPNFGIAYRIIKLYWKGKYVDFQGSKPRDEDAQSSSVQFEKGVPIHKEDIEKVRIKVIGQQNAPFNWVIWMNPRTFTLTDFEDFCEALKTRRNAMTEAWTKFKNQKSDDFSFRIPNTFPINYVIWGDYTSLQNRYFMRKHNEEDFDEVIVSIEGNVIFCKAQNGFKKFNYFGVISQGGDTLTVKQTENDSEMKLKISDFSDFKNSDEKRIDEVYWVVVE
jgi:hypothetical protein